MKLVHSNCVTGSQTQCLVDLATVREDLTYSAALPGLHGIN